MRFTLITLALAACSSASFILPRAQAPDLTAIFGEPTYSCQGSSGCSGPVLKVKACDVAANTNLDRTDERKYVAGKNSGVSQYEPAASCGVFVKGEDKDGACRMSGNQMWWAYQELRKHDCKKCGGIKFSGGCEFRVDRVTS